jgi:hypothetical protein
VSRSLRTWSPRTRSLRTRSLRTWSMPLAAAAILAAVPAPAFADGVIDPGPIGPHQAFLGEVNDATTNATIKMACFGPVFPGETGHPMDGQTVKAVPISTPTPLRPGSTGSAATEIGVGCGLSSSALPPIVLHMWVAPAKIPTTLTLPCYGTGTVTFVPLPSSPTARSATVQVTFVGQP